MNYLKIEGSGKGVLLSHFLFSPLILLLMIYSCNKSGKDTYNLLPNVVLPDEQKNLCSMYLSEISDSIRLIPLETSIGSLIGKIYLINADSQNIIIYDNLQNKTLRFNNYGKFLNTIGKPGKGPGEYSTIYDIEIDENQNVWLFDPIQNNLLCYSLADSLIRAIHVKEFISSFEIRNEELVFFNPITRSRYTKNFSIISTNQEMMRKSYYWQREKYDLKTVAPFAIDKIGDIIFIWEHETDEILQFKVDRIETLCHLKYFNNKKVSESFFSDQVIMKDEIKDHASISRIVFAKDYLFISYIEYYVYSIFVNLKEGKTFILHFNGGNGFINDFMGGLEFWPKYVSEDGVLIDYIEPSLLKDKNLSERITNRGESKILRNSLLDIPVENNPILIYCYPKR